MAAEERRRVREHGGRPDDWDRPSTEELALEAADEEAADEAADELEVSRFQALLQDRRKIVSGILLVLLLVVAIYVLFPKIVGADEAVSNLDEAEWYWILVAIGFNVLAFAAYVALFRGILGGTRDDLVHRRLDLRASYQITMAGLAATRIFSAAGAGGIVLTYWALRKAGMPRRRAACRMVAFLVLTYFVYLAALVAFGVLLRTSVLPGRAPLAGTVVPAAIAAGIILLFGMIALIPQDFERRIQHYAGGYRRTRYLQRIAKGPATLATGVRTAIAYLRHPQRGLLAVGGAVGFWAANIGVLWAAFEAFGGHVPLRRARAGLLRRHGREPDPVAGRGRGRRRCRHDWGILNFRDRRLGGVPRGAHVPRDRVLAADPAGDRGVHPASQDGRGVGARDWGGKGRREGYTSESEVLSVEME